MTTRPSCLNAHVALHQRVRADDEMDRARLRPRASCSRRAAVAGRAGQQRDAEPRRLQQPRDVQ